MLEKRKTAIREGLEQAEEARLRLEKVVDEEKLILKNAQVQAVTMIEDAKSQAEDIAKAAHTSAQKHAQQIIQDAKDHIQNEVKNAELQLSTKTSVLAVEYLKKALKELFDETNQEEILSKAVRIIKKRRID